MTKFIFAALALTGLVSFTSVSAEACNGSLTDDSASCNGYDDNQSANEMRCRLYGRTYDLGKTCEQFNYQTPNRGRQSRVICEVKDRSGNRYRVEGTTRRAKNAQSQAMKYCYDNSSSPRSCVFHGCYSK